MFIWIYIIDTKMKKIVFAILILSGFGLNAQKTEYDWKNMDLKQFF